MKRIDGRWVFGLWLICALGCDPAGKETESPDDGGVPADDATTREEPVGAACKDGETEARVRYEAAEVSADELCKAEAQSRTCVDGHFGAFSGTFTSEHCQVATRQSCEDLPHGGIATRTRYAAASVPAGQTCAFEVQTQTCEDGELSDWSGSYTELSCMVEGELACDGKPSGTVETQVRYRSEEVPYDSACEPEAQKRTCMNGTWSDFDGTFSAESCHLALPRACGNVAHGALESRVMYFAPEVVNGECEQEAQTRTCVDGTFTSWSGSASYLSCGQCSDADRDGYGEGCSNGKDCDDHRTDISPARREVEWNEIDENCDGKLGRRFGSASTAGGRRSRLDHVMMSGDYVLDLDGDTLRFWATAALDAAEPAHAVRLEGLAAGEGTRRIAASSAALAVVELGDPADDRALDVFSLEGQGAATHLATLQGSAAVVGDDGRSLLVWREDRTITVYTVNETSLSVRVKLDAQLLGCEPYPLSARGELAYLWCGSDALVYDLDEGKTLGRVTLPDTPWDLQVAAPYLAASNESGDQLELIWVDFQKPDAPVKTVTEVTLDRSSQFGMDARGVFYLRDAVPTEPMQLCFASPTGQSKCGDLGMQDYGAASRVLVSGSRAVVADGAMLAAYDVSSATGPRLLPGRRFSVSNDVVQVERGRAYIASPGALAVYDVENSSGPLATLAFSEGLAFPNGHSIALASQGDLLFVSEPDAFFVFDVSDAKAPRLVKSMALPFLGGTRALSRFGRSLLVGADRNELHVVDVTDPLAPKLLPSDDDWAEYESPYVQIEVDSRFIYARHTACVTASTGSCYTEISAFELAEPGNGYAQHHLVRARRWDAQTEAYPTPFVVADGSVYWTSACGLNSAKGGQATQCASTVPGASWLSTLGSAVLMGSSGAGQKSLHAGNGLLFVPVDVGPPSKLPRYRQAVVGDANDAAFILSEKGTVLFRPVLTD